MFNALPGPLYPGGKEAVIIIQEAGWAPGPVWTGVENLVPTGFRSSDLPARIQSLCYTDYVILLLVTICIYGYLTALKKVRLYSNK